MKTRFAPSPTGFIHLGNTRTALFSALYAFSQGGEFLLRMEDTDQARSALRFAEGLMEDLRWLGLDWQEGPGIEGPHGPYWQSQRTEMYENYYQKLLTEEKAYFCFCSEEALAVQRKLQRARSMAPRYAGTCRHLSCQEIAEKRAEGLVPVIRFRVPEHQTVEFEDFVKGPQVFKTDDIGDFIIQRSTGASSFMFCSVIDDALMGVTHVMRGEDHLTNTPRQLMIMQALGLQAPQYGHISLITGQDGGALSKRNGSMSIMDLRDQGYLPLAIVNYLARLGHHYPDNQLLDLSQLAAGFSVAHLSHSPARFDPAQLHFWQKQAVQHMMDAKAREWLAPYLVDIPVDLQPVFIEAIKPNLVFAQEAMLWAEVFSKQPLHCSHEAMLALREAGEAFFEAALLAVKTHGADYQAICDALKATCGVKGKQLFMPLRAALTGQIYGPEFSYIFQLLDEAGLTARLREALEKVRNSE